MVLAETRGELRAEGVGNLELGRGELRVGEGGYIQDGMFRNKKDLFLHLLYPGCKKKI